MSDARLVVAVVAASKPLWTSSVILMEEGESKLRQLLRMRKALILVIAIMTTGALRGTAGLSPLEALAMIESGNNDHAVGTFGEISRYQILPRVWRSYSPSWNYNNPSQASEVAVRHLEFLEGNFRIRAGREPSDYDRYVLWNAGLAYYTRLGFNPERVAPIIRERANRYVNLCQMTQDVAWK